MRFRVRLPLVLALILAVPASAAAPTARPTIKPHAAIYSLDAWAMADRAEQLAYLAGVIDTISALVYESVALEHYGAEVATVYALHKAARSVQAVAPLDIGRLANMVLIMASRYPPGTPAALAVWDVAGELADMTR